MNHDLPIDGLDGMLPHKSREAVLERELMLKDAEIAKLKDDLRSQANNHSTDMAQARQDDFADQWISIDERLPNYFVDVLVAVCAQLSASESHMARLIGGQWNVVSGNGNHADFITHWMPLPTPPKESA